LVSTTISSLETSSTFLKNWYLTQNASDYLSAVDLISQYLDVLQAFFEKYSDFFTPIDKQFGYEFSEPASTGRKLVNDANNSVKQLQIAIAKDNSDPAIIQIRNRLLQEIAGIKPVWNLVSTIPYTIDYSRLSKVDWKRIGSPGIDYRSRIFFELCFQR
jgi:hypothetical protein